MRGIPTPSEHQQSVIRWCLEKLGHLVVNAVAGSGKSTLLSMIAQIILGNAVYLAFNRHVASAARSKVAPHDARTIHSLGYKAFLRRYNPNGGHAPWGKPDAQKYRRITRAACNVMEGSRFLYDRQVTKEEQEKLFGVRGEILYNIYDDIVELVDLSRANYVGESKDFPKDLKFLNQHFGVGVPKKLEQLVFHGVAHALEEGYAMREREIDFEDQIWIPLREGLPIGNYDWILLDECQDLSRSKIELVRRALAEDGRLVGVGDPHQAIMGFSGADAFAFDRIKRSFAAQELPLSVCYRCPISSIDRAKEFVPQIEHAPGAIEGSVMTVSFADALRTVRANDLVQCRRNAPLVGFYFALLRRRVADIATKRAELSAMRPTGAANGPAIESDIPLARVRGRPEDTERMINVIKKFGRGNLIDFPAFVDQWRVSQWKKIDADNGSDERKRTVSDIAEILGTIYDEVSDECVNSDQLISFVRKIFGEPKKKESGASCVILSSIHRAKGDEADEVFILRPDLLMPPETVTDTWQQEQELNIHYVAVTRAKKRLIFVN